MTRTVKAIYNNGALKLFEPIQLEDGAQVDVVVIAPDPVNGTEFQSEDSWNALTSLIDECAIDTGIGDLAQQHDHYLYNTPKRDH
jgi:predicted DNA-binding antitoxin AbrB/MazE fold protein